MTDGILYDTVRDMDISKRIGDTLDRLLTENHIGRREFARTMGIPMTSYSRLLKGTTVPLVTTLYKALGAMNHLLLARGKGPITMQTILRECPKYGTNAE